MIARQLSLKSNFLSPFLHVISRKRSNSMTETIASSQSTTLFQYIFFFCNHFTICAPTTWLAAQKGRSPTSESLLKILDLSTIHKRHRVAARNSSNSTIFSPFSSMCATFNTSASCANVAEFLFLFIASFQLGPAGKETISESRSKEIVRLFSLDR